MFVFTINLFLICLFENAEGCPFLFFTVNILEVWSLRLLEFILLQHTIDCSGIPEGKDKIEKSSNVVALHFHLDPQPSFLGPFLNYMLECDPFRKSVKSSLKVFGKKIINCLPLSCTHHFSFVDILNIDTEALSKLANRIRQYWWWMCCVMNQSFFGAKGRGAAVTRIANRLILSLRKQHEIEWCFAKYLLKTGSSFTLQ